MCVIENGEWHTVTGALRRDSQSCFQWGDKGVTRAAFSMVGEEADMCALIPMRCNNHAGRF